MLEVLVVLSDSRPKWVSRGSTTLSTSTPVGLHLPLATVLSLDRWRTSQLLQFIIAEMSTEELKFDKADLVEEVIAVIVVSVHD